MLKVAIVEFHSSPGKLTELRATVTAYATALVSYGFIARNSWSLYEHREQASMLLSGVLCHPRAIQDSMASSQLASCVCDLRHALSGEPVINYWDYANSEDDCYCDHEEWQQILIICDERTGISPLRCMSCSGCVGTYRIGASSMAIQELWLWDSQYRGISEVWLANGHYEHWAEAALFDVRSPLNSLGISIAASIGTELGLEVFYYLGTTGESVHANCPRCRGQLHRIGAVQCSALCPNCRIVTQGGNSGGGKKNREKGEGRKEGHS